jgi:hypothetical protein
MNKRTSARLPGVLALTLCAAMGARPALADDLDEMRKLHQSTVDMVNQLLQQGLITRERADQIIKQAQQTAGPWAQAPAVPAAAAVLPAAPQADAAAPAAVAATPAAAAPAAPAASPSTNDLLKALVEVGVISKEKAYELQQDAQRQAAVEIPATASPEATPQQRDAAGAAAPAKPGEKSTVRVPYVPEIVKQQIRDQVKEEVINQARRERWGDPGVLPEWLKRLTWSGDIRLRAETDLFPTDGAPNVKPSLVDFNQPYYYNLTNTGTTNNRLRVRARFGFEARLAEQLTAGVRVATGGAAGGSNPATENVTLGNYDTRYAIGLDRAYLRYQPAPWAAFAGGRVGNPFFTPTDLVWNDTVSLDGFYTKLSHELSRDVDGVLVAGAFPIQLQDNQSFNYLTKTYSKWLFAYQGGVHWQFLPRDDIKLAAAYYDYHRVEGIAADIGNVHQYDNTAAGFRQKGNQAFDIEAVVDTPTGISQPAFIGLVSKFRVLDASTALDIANFAPMHVILSGDYVRNLGFHADEIERRTRITDADILRARVTGYQFKLQVGNERIGAYGDWQGYAGYRHVERDAVLDAFTDTDFHLGGTDAKGYFVGGRYGLVRGAYIGMRWLSASSIDGPPLAIDVLQLDLNAAF